jgi:hypothetical protein
MDAPRPPARPPGGAAIPGPLPPPSAQLEPQRKSRQPDLFSFFRVEEQAAERMEVIALKAAEAKAAAEERAAGVPPKREGLA